MRGQHKGRLILWVARFMIYIVDVIQVNFFFQFSYTIYDIMWLCSEIVLKHTPIESLHVKMADILKQIF